MVRVYVERRELPDDLQQLLEAGVAAVEFTPPIDILETESGLQIVLDLPGVDIRHVEVIFSSNVLLIAGDKAPGPPGHADAAFHVAERAFGRFARAIGIEGAFDAGKAVATLKHGELRVVLPRLKDRRGGRIRIPVN
jgi:HSP20 family molecular chaperone IbpA